MGEDNPPGEDSNHQVANEPVVGKEAISEMFTGMRFFQVVNGKIVFQRGYWDKLSFLKQHNLPIE